MAHEIWTGRMAEGDLFGEVSPKLTKEEFDRFETERRRSGKSEYTITSLVKMIKKMQPQNPNIPSSPTNPSKSYARELRKALVERIYGDPSQSDHLRFYTTVRSYLDYKGVDGVFVMDDLEEGGIKMALVDLTKNPEKIENGKGSEGLADVIIEIPQDVDLEESSESFQNFVQDSASLIQGSFRRRT